MTVSDAIIKMIGFYHGNHHDINHFLKVYAYAKTIGEGERLSAEVQQSLEFGAVVHDIACPLCREKYGSAIAQKQEAEGIALTYQFFADTDISTELLDRVVYLVSHHHTLDNIEGLDYQILVEADYLVNAEEKGFSTEDIQIFDELIFKTRTGKRILQALFLNN